MKLLSNVNSFVTSMTRESTTTEMDVKMYLIILPNTFMQNIYDYSPIIFILLNLKGIHS